MQQCKSTVLRITTPVTGFVSVWEFRVIVTKFCEKSLFLFLLVRGEEERNFLFPGAALGLCLPG
jgi:hypothetical protein